jgi:methionyl-tRNA formyltransferase
LWVHDEGTIELRGSVHGYIEPGTPSGVNMDVVFLGVNDIGFEIYEWLCDRSSVNVRALVTTEPQLELVDRLSPDAVASVGFDYQVPTEVLDVPERGCVNLHPSYLPYNRGKSPNVWSIVNGTPVGVTFHYMNEDIDEGDIIARRRIETSFADTGKDLHRRLERAQFDLFTDVWPEFESGAVEVTPQRQTDGRFHTVEDFRALCEIDPDAEYTARDLLDRLRALTFPPFDNAYVEIDDERYYLELSIRPDDDTPEREPDGHLSSY